MARQKALRGSGATASRSRCAGLPVVMMEIFSIPLILFVMSDPEFDRNDWQPPVFQISEKEEEAPPESPKPLPYMLAVGADGLVLCDGQTTDFDSLIEKIRRTIKPDQNIRLLIETSEDGNGNVSSSMQVLSLLGPTELWKRTRQEAGSTDERKDS